MVLSSFSFSGFLQTQHIEYVSCGYVADQIVLHLNINPHPSSIKLTSTTTSGDWREHFLSPSAFSTFTCKVGANVEP
jgi:hypothetical protein